MLSFKWQFIIIILTFVFTGGTIAGSVYSWTDENGVKVFSDTPPADDVKDLSKTVKIEIDEAAERKSKAAYDQMVKQATMETEETAEANQEQKVRAAAEENAQKDEASKQNINAEMQRLQGEIAKIEARGLGPNFTQGMKDNMIRQIQEQMAALSNTP